MAGTRVVNDIAGKVRKIGAAAGTEVAAEGAVVAIIA